ncbi:MAG: hypothetical protein HN348_05465 [Proteobacteria bacterium]|jgi:hypothetical protein|nr:hypothetical protein [Pseudomonadota bacterium]
MPRRGFSLGERFKAAASKALEANQLAKEEREARLARERVARDELMEDLAAFGATVGLIEVQRHEGGVTLGYEDRFLHFEALDDGGAIKVKFDGSAEEDNTLYRESELSNRWVWQRKKGRRDDRLPLFDQGLEELVIHALRLPRPDAALPNATPDDASEVAQAKRML